MPLKKNEEDSFVDDFENTSDPLGLLTVDILLYFVFIWKSRQSELSSFKCSQNLISSGTAHSFSPESQGASSSNDLATTYSSLLRLYWTSFYPFTSLHSRKIGLLRSKGVIFVASKSNLVFISLLSFLRFF